MSNDYITIVRYFRSFVKEKRKHCGIRILSIWNSFSEPNSPELYYVWINTLNCEKKIWTKSELCMLFFFVFTSNTNCFSVLDTARFTRCTNHAQWFTLNHMPLQNINRVVQLQCCLTLSDDLCQSSGLHESIFFCFDTSLGKFVKSRALSYLFDGFIG